VPGAAIGTTGSDSDSGQLWGKPKQPFRLNPQIFMAAHIFGGMRKS
jgi:hypothetical protein